jgi:hypothetical protein
MSLLIFWDGTPFNSMTPCTAYKVGFLWGVVVCTVFHEYRYVAIGGVGFFAISSPVIFKI